jgi:hypothetical protein
VSGATPFVRHLGGGLVSHGGPLSLRDARALAAGLRGRLAQIEEAIHAAEQWRRAAGWRDCDAADAWPFGSTGD